jgi:hypothetical protein
VLSGADAEFLLEKVASGRYKIRIGQIWKMPELSGQSYLLLDLDNQKKRPNIGEIRRRISRCGLRVLQIQTRRSPSGTGFHCVVTIRGKHLRMERIALQAILESDFNREAENFKRAKLALPEWGENWNVLFRK